jgi:hypothetical protein
MVEQTTVQMTPFTRHLLQLIALLPSLQTVARRIVLDLLVDRAWMTPTAKLRLDFF